MLHNAKKPKNVRNFGLLVLTIFALSGCTSNFKHSAEALTGKGKLYFKTPMEAVEVLSSLMSASDWETIARYYDLSGTAVKHEELESGRFFLYSNPVPGPPFMKKPSIRYPFAPGFRYERHASDGGDTVRVYLHIEIDQGGGMVQRSLDAFKLRKSDAGYQVLPGEVSYFDR